jgi:hypothetical protein
MISVLEIEVYILVQLLAKGRPELIQNGGNITDGATYVCIDGSKIT